MTYADAIRAVLTDPKGREVRFSEMVDALTEGTDRSARTVAHGRVTGTLSAMLKRGEVERVGRGVYVYAWPTCPRCGQSVRT